MILALSHASAGPQDAILTVTYTDGSTQVFNQDISDFLNGYTGTAGTTGPGESIAVSMSQYNNATYEQITPGGSTHLAYLYGYDFALNPTKTVEKLTLNNIPGAIIFAMDLVSKSQVNLNEPGSTNDNDPAFNAVGITVNGFGSAGNLDHDGNSYSANALGNTVTWDGATFNIGDAGINDVDEVVGWPIYLPPTEGTDLLVLGSATHGVQSATVTVYYTDGSWTEYTQSFSDWMGTGTTQTGESVVMSMSSFNNASGTQSGTVYLYGYDFPLNPAKTVSYLALSNDNDVNILAVDVVNRPNQVNLLGSFNNTGIYTDGSTFSSSGGFDGTGDALSASIIGTQVAWSGQTFDIGLPGDSDVVSADATGQTIPLPAGNYNEILFLATGVNGDQAGLVFQVNYTDGTHSQFTQSFSDWFTPQYYAGESIAVTMPYRDTSTGGKDARTFYIYGYTQPLTNGKTVASITLPNDPNPNGLGLELLAIDLVNTNLSGGVGQSGGGPEIVVAHIPIVSTRPGPKGPVIIGKPTPALIVASAKPSTSAGVAAAKVRLTDVAPSIRVSYTGAHAASASSNAEGWIALPADTWLPQTESRRKKNSFGLPLIE